MLNKTSLTFDEIGKVQLLQPTILPADTTDKVTWFSTNTGVVTVNDGGVVMSVGTGECEIYARCGEQQAICDVSVVVEDTTCTSIVLDYSNLTLYADGDKHQLIASVTPQTCADPIQWSSKNPSVATVDSSGLITPKNIGNAFIIAKCGDFSSSCMVKVITRYVCTGLDCNIPSLTMNLGSTYYLAQHISFVPPACTDKIYWSSTNIDAATIDENGLIKAVGVGVTHINITCGDQKVVLEVTIES